MLWMIGAVVVSAAGAWGRQDGGRAPVMEEYAARQVARLAVFDLRVTPQPGERDFRIASLLLSLCQELQPDDQEILRRRIEAAWAGGDTGTVVQETERLLRLDPQDTVALLRLITSRLAQLQTVEERIAAYDSLLDAAGKGRHLDPSIRSRLALDAALLHRERGEEEAFVQKLTRAVQLDPTHKEAAALAAAYAGNQVGVLERLDLFANVLLADPVDPNVHLAIARELTIGGAYRGAARFLAIARSIAAASGGSFDELNRQDLILKWYLQGPRAVVEVLNAERMDRVKAAVKRLQEAQAAGLPTDNMDRPEDVKLAPVFGFMAAAALDAAGDHPAAEAMVADAGLTAARLAQVGLDPQQRPADMTEQQAIVQAVTLGAELQVFRLWTNTQIEGVQQALGDEAPLVKFRAGVVPLLRAWLKARTGDAPGAVADLEPMADGDPVMRLAYAQALELAGDLPRALEQYERVVRDAPLAVPGAWSRWRLGSLGVSLDRGRVEELERWASPGPGGAVPNWVDRAVAEPKVVLEAHLSRTSCEALDRQTVTVVIENIGPRPLALGPDRPINSRLLFAPKFEVPLGPLERLARPEVIDLDRRLRLMPRERIEARVWPDAGESGLLLEMLSSFNMRVRWRVIQGFWIDPQGGYRPGPMCEQTETGPLVRQSLAEASVSIAEHGRKVLGDPEELLPRVAAGLRTALMVQPDAEMSPPEEEMIKGIGGAWAMRWTRLSPTARIMAAAVIPSRQFSSSLAALDDTMRTDSDPKVLAVVLVTRVTDPADELLKRARESDDARVAELARLVGDRLAEGTKVYATLNARDLWLVKEQAEAPR